MSEPYTEDDDSGWPYPDHDRPDSDLPSMPTFTYLNDELYDQFNDSDPYAEDDDPVETDDPYDMRGWN